jgi:hypothetical protein
MKDISLQKLDCNCNDCANMVRDFKKFKSFDHLHTNKHGQKENSGSRLHYGHCTKLDKAVSFLPNTCQIHTQKCFKHRRES